MGKQFGSTLDLPQVTTPASPAAGRTLLYVKSDGKVYTKDSAGNETLVGGGGATGVESEVAVSATQPTVSAGLPELWVDTTTTAVPSAQGPPVGTMQMYAGASAPAGYLLCDGTVRNISDYPALGALLGATYGGNGTTTFAPPDMRGRVAVGVGTAVGAAGATAHTLGQSAGEEAHTLTLAELPKGPDGYAAVYPTTSAAIRPGMAGGTALGNGGTIVLNVNYGVQGNTPSNVMQPYVGINFIIRY